MQSFEFKDPDRKDEEKDQENLNLTDDQKEQHLRLMSWINFISSMSFSYLMPFFPDVAKEAGLPFTQIGLVVSASSISSIFFSIPIGKLVSKLGRKKSISIALTIQVVAMFVNGSVSFLTFDHYFFLVTAIIGRILFGLCRTIYLIVVYSYIDVYFKGEFQKKFSKFEMLGGLGFLVGPVIGSALNYGIGFAGPMYVYMISIFLLFMMLRQKLPSDDKFKSPFKQEKPNVPMLMIMKSARVLLLILDGMFTLGSLNYSNSFFVNHMKSYGIGGNLAAFILVIPAFMNILLLNVIPKLGKFFMKQFTISVGLLINVFGNSIMAPFWGTSETPFPFIIGTICLGISFPFQRVPTIPLQAENLGRIFIDADQQTLTQISSSLYTMSLGLTNLSLPPIGGAIYDHLGGDVDGTTEPLEERYAYRWAILWFVIAESVVWVLYFLFAEGYKGWIDIIKKCARRPIPPESDLTISMMIQNNHTGTDGSESDSSEDMTSQIRPKIYREEITKEPV